MPHVLHVEASPRRERSASIATARAFLNAWGARNPDATVDTLDVWSTPLPEFDGEALAGKYAALAGEPLSPAQEEAWGAIRALAERFRAADLLLFSVPMWNYTIPYKLKHLLDLVSQKDLLFSFDERGQNGLLRGRAVVAYARGVGLGPESFPREIWDHQTTYMKTWLLMVGITEVHEIEVETQLMGEDAASEARRRGREQAEQLAASL